MKARFLITGVVVLAVTLLAAAPAVAQQAVQDGRALDANPQAGSGGVNRPEGMIDYRARNDVITGNVGDGRAFRGVVDYRAPGDFGDPIGTDDLFRFRADSLSSGLDRLNAVQAGRDYALGRGPTVLRSQASPQVDRIMTPVPRDISIGGDYRLPRTTPEDFARRLEDPFDPEFGRVGDPRGRALQVSPLLGVRPLDDVAPTDTWFRVPTPAPEPESDPADPDAPDGLDALDGEPRERDARMAPLELPGLVLGQQLGAPRQAAAGRPIARDPDAVARLHRELLEQRYADRQAAPGEDAYADLLRALRGEPADRDRQPDLRVPPDRLGEAAGPEARDEAARADAGWLLDVDEPTQRQLERAERARDEARERADDDRAMLGPLGMDADDDAEQRAAATAEALEALLERLNYRLPRLESLTGARDDRLSEQMRNAEAALTADEYLRAERLYRRVLAEHPHEPLARVGMIHAQLGAGMYRSAGLHMRHLFERHPELIAARYGRDVLPGVERLQAARDELERIAAEDDARARDAGVLLAYLGHQIESPRLVQLGLARAEAATPHDPLLNILRRLWLGERE